MERLLLAVSCIVLLGSCNDKGPAPKVTAAATIRTADKPVYQGLLGTWVRRGKTGFTMIDIRDTSDVLYREFIDRGGKDGYYYYSSKGTLGYWGAKTIWISTEKFRFDYKVKGDTLIGFDKEGDAGVFIKVYTDEQKGFILLDTTNVKGVLSYINKIGAYEHFAVGNADAEYILGCNPKGDFFASLAAIGDSLIKPANADTVVLVKQHGGKTYKFPFTR
jgi:hypothetical protein